MSAPNQIAAGSHCRGGTPAVVAAGSGRRLGRASVPPSGRSYRAPDYEARRAARLSEFGRRIIAGEDPLMLLRTTQGLQSSVALALGVSVPAVHFWAHRERLVPEQRIAGLAAVIGVPEEVLRPLVCRKVAAP